MSARIGGPVAYTPQMAVASVHRYYVCWTGKQGERKEGFERESDARRYMQSLYRVGIKAGVETA
jgi:hypothetical protein